MEQNIFPIKVFKTKIIPDQEQYNSFDNLLTEMFSKADDSVWALETGRSTGQHNLYLHTEPAAAWLMEKAFAHVCNFWESLGYRRGANIRITSSWANLHKFGQVTGEHSHYGGAIRAHISAVYYFKKPLNSGNIEFVDPLEYIRKMEPIHEYSEYTPEGIAHMYTPVESEQFDLVLFPSWLKHRTQPSQSYDDRVAVSINFLGLY